ncbi:MAG: arsenite efflux transporter metallochaperone ArsD [Dehalogenimonas sp.]
MKIVEIYDPAMCCSTGVCGPSIDPELMRVAATVNAFKDKGIIIQRYGLSTDTQRFISNPVISELLEKEGASALPITLFDGKLVKTKTYPTDQEFMDWLGPKLDVVKPPRRRGCCGLDEECC